MNIYMHMKYKIYVRSKKYINSDIRTFPFIFLGTIRIINTQVLNNRDINKIK